VAKQLQVRLQTDSVLIEYQANRFTKNKKPQKRCFCFANGFGAE
jgi:hypothetical protein